MLFKLHAINGYNVSGPLSSEPLVASKHGSASEQLGFC